MFCPKCGTQNPETGKFCRSCGTDLGNVSDALTGKLHSAVPLVDRKGKPVSYERAIVKIFTGFAFIAVAAALAITSNGRGWWFWMLIPAFTSLGAGIAQYVQLRRADRGLPIYAPGVTQPQVSGTQQSALPPTQTSYVAPDSRFKTGDLVPPSVTDNTTRHLEMESEDKTRALPKNDL
jgi:hypothetical protein